MGSGPGMKVWAEREAPIRNNSPILLLVDCPCQTQSATGAPVAGCSSAYPGSTYQTKQSEEMKLKKKREEKKEKRWGKKGPDFLGSFLPTPPILTNPQRQSQLTQLERVVGPPKSKDGKQACREQLGQARQATSHPHPRSQSETRRQGRLVREG